MSDQFESTVWDQRRLSSPHTQSDKAHRVRRMFDAIAPTYRLINTLASGGRDTRWRREMVKLAHVRSNETLLDIACGTGDVAHTFATSKTPPAQIFGLDFSFQMLKLADRNFGPPGPLVQADALHLPFADESVSIVTCAFGIRNFQSLDEGLSEMYRVLKPAGRAVILEFTVPQQAVFRQLYLAYVNRVMPILASLVSRDRTGAYRYLPRSMLSFHGREQVVEVLRSAGFLRVTTHPLSLGIVTIYVAGKTGED